MIKSTYDGLGGKNMDKSITLRLRQYEIISAVNHGVSSNVYLVRDEVYDSLMILKIMKKNKMSKIQYHNEIRGLNLIKDIRVPRIYMHDEDASNYYILEEYYPGSTLLEILLKGITLKEFITYGIKIGEILIMCHGRNNEGFIYHDIKPEHIIVEGETLSLVDYGQISFIDEVDTKTACKREWEEYVNLLKNIQGSIKEDISKAYKERIKSLYEDLIDAGDMNLSTIPEVVRELYCIKELLENEKVIRHSKGNSKTIAVIGSNERVGCTYTSFILVSGINSLKRKAAYVDCSYCEGVKDYYKRKEANKARYRKVDIVNNVSEFTINSYQYTGQYSNYYKLKTWDKTQLSNYDYLIYDLGINYEPCELASYDEVILVLGGRRWEFYQTIEAIDNLKDLKSIHYVCSMQEKGDVMSLVKMTGLTIYHLPLNPNPYKGSREIKRFILNERL